VARPPKTDGIAPEDARRGGRIFELVQDSGENQRKFAESIGIHPNALSNLVLGRTAPLGETLHRLVKKTRAYPEWILYGRGEKLIPPGMPIPRLTPSPRSISRGHPDLVRWMTGTAKGRAASSEAKAFLRTMPWPEDERVPDAAFEFALRAYEEVYSGKRD
jgi:transcriptional regulator with XRE-family HTH domain